MSFVFLIAELADRIADMVIVFVCVTVGFEDISGLKKHLE